MGTEKTQILDGMDVVDCDGSKVGRVTRYDAKLGYFEVHGTFGGARYLPATSIEKISATGVQLNVTKSYVSEIYRHAPAVTPSLTSDGRLAGGASAPDGWTGRRVPLDAGALNALREKIAVGAPIFDADDKKVGKVDAYDPNTGYMRIEKAGLSAKDIFLPVTSVGFLDDRGVHLAETKETIANRFSRFPEIAKDHFAR
jgi:hypothetical protein